MNNAGDLAETLLGPVEWIDAEHGFCACPGQLRHTKPSKARDCEIFLGGVPSLHCFHSSCQNEIDDANRRLRSALATGTAQSADKGSRAARNFAETARQRERRAFERLKARARNSKSQVLREYATDPAGLFEQSPCRLLEGPENDWRLLLGLFRPADVVWIGNVMDSGTGHEWNFRPVSEWLAQPRPPGPFTCPSVFKPGVCSRSKENVVSTPFLVVESDLLTKPEICAVFSWLRQFLSLRAVVDTGGKSLHGWFDHPASPAVEGELKIILPPLGCDPAMFKPSQPCRLPGVKRGPGVQALLYMDIGGRGPDTRPPELIPAPPKMPIGPELIINSPEYPKKSVKPGGLNTPPR